MRIIDKNISVQNRGLYRATRSTHSIDSVQEGQANQWVNIPKEKGETQVLSDTEILELSELVLKIENHYGFPCDIEWAFEKGKFYIVQSRPITTLSGISQSSKTKSLAQKFELLVEGNELYPIVYNGSIFTFGSAYNIRKFFSKEIAPDIPPYHLIIIDAIDKSIWAFPAAPIKYLSKCAFHEFVTFGQDIFVREKKFESFKPFVEQTYHTLTPEKIIELPEPELILKVTKIIDSIWSANAWAHFTILFDKEMCIEFSKTESLHITEAQLNEIWEKATHLISPSFDVQQKQNILRLIASGDTWSQIAVKCQYVYTNYNEVFSIAQVKNKILDAYGTYTITQIKKELARIENIYKTEVEEYSKWLSTLSQEQQVIAQYCQMVMRLRDARKNFFAMGLTSVWRIAELLFERANISQKYIRFVVIQNELIKGSSYLAQIKSEIEKRANGCSVLISFNGDIELTTESVVEDMKYVQGLYAQQNIHLAHTDQLRGQTANKGKVRGLVRVIINITQHTNLNPGEILVAGMTRPEYVPIMKQASAVVTDEGGITCHAAIVSRELGIPCIIGTKFATQILHDGDLVEVDANEGVVRILERAGDKK